MTRIALIFIAVAVSACTPAPQDTAIDKGDFAVVRGGVDIDARAIACANDPQSVGFDTMQECFADAQRLMEGG